MQTVTAKIAQIENIIHQDFGNRGVKKLFHSGDVLNATKCLVDAKHVAIVTGFFIPRVAQPETDGPLGALALAQALLALGKKVTLISDTWCIKAIKACCASIKKSLRDRLKIEIFPIDSTQESKFIKYICSNVDCLVAIERVGRAADHKYYTMRGIDITQTTAPLDDLFLYSQSHPELGITSIGIGDGGNEIGMGLEKTAIARYIPKGTLIGCVIPVDHLIVTGVSNWGGYALAGALACWAAEQKAYKSRLRSIYPSAKTQFAMLQNMVKCHCCDGVTLKQAPSVDGLPWSVHEKIFNKIGSCV